MAGSSLDTVASVATKNLEPHRRLLGGATRRGGSHLASLAFAAITIGCGEGSRPDGATSSSSGGAQSSTSAGAESAASASATATPARPRPAVLGRYEGAYEAKKLEIALDKGVKAKDWKADDGATLAGPGTIVVTVDDAGEAKGTIEGSLGKGTLSGMVEEGNKLNLALSPADPASPTAMTGFISLVLSESKLKGTLQASSSDGVYVRRSEVELAPSAPK